MLYERNVYDAWLASAEVPYDSLIPLLYRMNGSEKVFEELSKQGGVLKELLPDGCMKKLSQNAARDKMDAMNNSIKMHHIHSITILDGNYPNSLRRIPDPPGILLYQGNLNCLHHERIVAMIGSRNASFSGLKASEKIAFGLSRAGVTIVSGMAYGIDSASHQGCIKGKSPTIAVMGCGLDIIYPSGNRDLKKEILDHGGLMLSEYAPGSRPWGSHFPYRNRIISGISDAVVLMEAKIRSGSMRTVDHALRQGKEIYVYPGDPESLMFEGNRLLLRDGARYFSEAKDILADMDWLDNLSYVGQNIVCSAGFIPQNASEKSVYESLSRGILGFDELIQKTGLNSSELMRTLTVLQIRKVIDLLPGKKYQIRQD